MENTLSTTMLFLWCLLIKKRHLGVIFVSEYFHMLQDEPSTVRISWINQAKCALNGLIAYLQKMLSEGKVFARLAVGIHGLVDSSSEGSNSLTYVDCIAVPAGETITPLFWCQGIGSLGVPKELAMVMRADSHTA